MYCNHQTCTSFWRFHASGCFESRLWILTCVLSCMFTKENKKIFHLTVPSLPSHIPAPRSSDDMVSQEPLWNVLALSRRRI
ncbi:hypothetical protein GYMLUDRAFT_665396 [Collybiopsis luxurians FD-317 M1]|uniref:Uncharacterized protein n=1 Tax=Collybiopsis luxurians FD-317 M1 TaxID=944289 RepID=A0A0D0B8J7_9AGAR|nr:hypothetical protein GYMLUDRAFT_665396 [Collybiopsis luxurians FD-317 M1]